MYTQEWRPGLSCCFRTSALPEDVSELFTLSADQRQPFLLLTYTLLAHDNDVQKPPLGMLTTGAQEMERRASSWHSCGWRSSTTSHGSTVKAHRRDQQLHVARRHAGTIAICILMIPDVIITIVTVPVAIIILIEDLLGGRCEYTGIHA
jgi:hypothetical protein